MYETSLYIERFNFHDSPVRSIAAVGNEVQVSLEFGHIDASHPANPLDSSQCIKPCLVSFREVGSQSARVWSEEERDFRPHPEPMQPIRDEIMEFEVAKTTAGWSIKLTGFHEAGWAEWILQCQSVTVAWSEFSGRAWYES